MFWVKKTGEEAQNMAHDLLPKEMFCDDNLSVNEQKEAMAHRMLAK